MHSSPCRDVLIHQIVEPRIVSVGQKMSQFVDHYKLQERGRHIGKLGGKPDPSPLLVNRRPVRLHVLDVPLADNNADLGGPRVDEALDAAAQPTDVASIAIR